MLLGIVHEISNSIREEEGGIGVIRNITSCTTLRKWLVGIYKEIGREKAAIVTYWPTSVTAFGFLWGPPLDLLLLLLAGCGISIILTAILARS